MLDGAAETDKVAIEDGLATQKPIDPRPTKAEAEAMLQEQLAEAEEQQRELVAVPREGIDWWTWSVSGLGLVLSASLAVLWLQRRPR